MSQVKWICDRDPERLARYERRYPGVSSTRASTTSWRTTTVDAVVIATPVYTHFYLASRALDAGKHAFVEKPLAASSARGGRAGPRGASRRASP